MIRTPRKNNNLRGFSMVEFIVVIVIFSIMSGVSLFNYNAYRSTIEQTNVAQDIALTIRQAQVYGLSGSDRMIGSSSFDPDQVFGNEVLDITQDRSIRGIAFVGANSIVIFEDLNRNREYDPGIDRVVDERVIMSPRIDFDVCLVTGVAPTSWNDCVVTLHAEEAGAHHVSITFRRPYPDATIRFDGSEAYSYAVIRVNANYTSNERYIEVSPIGKISVKRSL